MELATILSRRAIVVAVIGLSAFMGLLWTVGQGVVNYASLYKQDGSQVLGEKTSTTAQTQCIQTETVHKFLTETQKTVNLYAPDQTINFSLEPLEACFETTGCSEEGFSCAKGKVTLNRECVAEYFTKYPLEVEQTRIVSGSGAVAQVKVRDWTVNYENLTEQLLNAVASEIKYCQVSGEEEQTRQNIGNLQLVVSDELPSMSGKDFTARFVELDASKEKAYFWNEGIPQTFTLKHGVRLPKEGIYRNSDIDFASIMDGMNASFITRTSQKTDYVVVHQ